VSKPEFMLKISDIAQGDWTYDDLGKLPDDGRRYEIIDGVLFVSPSPRTPHQRALGAIHALIWSWLRGNPIGEVFIAPFDVVFSQKSAVQPDVLFVSKARREVVQDVVRGSPDLVVEVLSSNPGLDRVKKFNLYQQRDVTHYWIVDPKQCLLEAYELIEGVYTLTWSGGGDDVFRPQVLPGFELELSILWETLL
jgi:Uma2 family endonuclease